MSRYIIVSGVPAAGKSTVAAGLAGRSSLPLFDKDRILETLFSGCTPNDLSDRRSLSTRADQQLESAVRETPYAIVVSWWRHPASHADSGTPIGWLRELRGSLVEVYCECAPKVAVERFSRRQRHPGHMDERWSRKDLLAQITEAAAFGPLNVGALVKVDAEKPVDFGVLWERVKSSLQGPNNELERARDG